MSPLPAPAVDVDMSMQMSTPPAPAVDADVKMMMSTPVPAPAEAAPAAAAIDNSALAYRWYTPQSASAPKVNGESEESGGNYVAWVKRNKLHRTEPGSAGAPRSFFARARDLLKAGGQRIRGKKAA